MTKEQIIEGNKLIAEFMGYKYYGWNEEPNTAAGWRKCGGPLIEKLHTEGNVGFRNFLCRSNNDLRFHNSYDWLMPVVEKLVSDNLSDFGFDCFKSKNRFMVYTCNDSVFGQQMESDRLMSAIYASAVNIIKWQNEQRKIADAMKNSN